VIPSRRRSVLPSDPSHRYQPFYCEENVFHLAAEPSLARRPREVVFISNAARSCPVWHQRAAPRDGWPILWDYHVVLLVATPWEVWDLDTTLGMPAPAQHYLRESFRAGVPDELAPRFRVVDAGAFVSTFASDRSHMRGAGGHYKEPPPPWPPLGAPGAEPNLARFVDVTAPFHGEVLDLRGLLARVAGA
jgi:protein N-terminal glutamine amidohydrolase